MTRIEFAGQITRLSPALHGFAMRYTNNLENAEDLVQDTMVKAFKYYNHFESGSNLKAWLFTIMKNTFLNDYKRNVKTQSLIMKTDVLGSAELTLSASVNKAETTMAMKDIYTALAMIPRYYAVPFISHFEGYKYHEIAETLNIPIGTVKTRIHEARKLLKAQLKAYDVS